MSPRTPRSAASPLLWFGVLGAPLAWGLQFGVGYWLTQGHCGVDGDWGSGPDLWTLILTILAAGTAIAAAATAVALFRATTEAEAEGAPPAGRTHFLAIVGMAIAPLFLAIILMNAVGVLVLSSCNQS